VRWSFFNSYRGPLTFSHTSNAAADQSATVLLQSDYYNKLNRLLMG